MRLRMIDNAQNQQRWAAAAAGLAFKGGRAKQIHVVGTVSRTQLAARAQGAPARRTGAHLCCPNTRYKKPFAFSFPAPSFEQCQAKANRIGRVTVFFFDAKMHSSEAKCRG